MKHYATPKFWFHYRQLTPEVQQLADKCYQLMNENPRHPSIRLKKVGVHWSARVGLHYRALARECDGGLLWFWIGHHGAYDRFENNP